MRTRTFVVLFGVIALACLLVCPLHAQQTEKRSQDEFLPVGEPEEPPSRMYDLFDVTSMIELGGQIAHIRGNNEVYRSHLNYSDGFRVFSFNIRGRATEETFLSDFYLQGAGWGGDPSNWIRWGASKDKWFDFRAHYRRQDYFWFFPGFARGQHLNDQQRRLQSYDLTLFPRRPVRVKLGYTRNSAFGLAFTTGDVEGTRDIFEMLEPIRRTYDEYRAGVEASYKAWNFFFEQGFRFFRNERLSRVVPECPAEDFARFVGCLLAQDFNAGNIATDPAVTFRLLRAQPIRGEISFTRFMISGRPHDTVEVTSRLVYSDIDIDHSRFEEVIATTFGGLPFREFVFGNSDADRPYTTWDGSVTWRPLRNLTISNHLRFDQWNVAGGGIPALLLTERFFNSLLGGSTETEEFVSLQLNSESWTNRFEGRYDFNRYVSVRAGFLYRHQDVEHVERELILEDGLVDDDEDCRTEPEGCPRIDLNRRSFLFGVTGRPHRTVSFFFDLERGNATGVFTRLSENNVDRIRTRVRWEPLEGVKFNASWFIFDNTNTNLPIEFSGLSQDGQHSTRNRGASINFTLSRYSRGYLHLGYGRRDVTTQTDVAFFAFFTPQIGRSDYFVNENYAYIDLGGRIAGNLYGDLGYRVTATSGTFPPSDPLVDCVLFTGVCDDAGALAPLQFFRGGLNHHQPHVALRYLFSDNVAWKAGWRWYGYNQKGGTLSDYKAHIITTSLVLTF